MQDGTERQRQCTNLRCPVQAGCRGCCGAVALLPLRAIATAAGWLPAAITIHPGGTLLLPCRYHCNLNILLGKLRSGGGTIKWADVAAVKAELEAQVGGSATGCMLV